METALSIVSIVLAVVSVAISVMFFLLGKSSSDKIERLASEIRSDTQTIKDSCNEALRKAFDILDSNSKTISDSLNKIVDKFPVGSMGESKKD